jgi:hypothetical protein
MDEDSHRKFVSKLLASPKAEALSWLKGGSDKSFRNLGEMDATEQSIAFVERIYALGARNVLAVKIVKWGAGENSGDLLVELPRDRFIRSELFAFEEQFAQSVGLDGSSDHGQLYLYLKLD